MSKSRYRILVLASFLLPIFGLLTEWRFKLLPIELAEVYDRYMFAGEISAQKIFLFWIGVLVLSVHLGAMYGLLQFRSWAPKVSLWICLGELFLICLLGPVLQSGFGFAMSALGDGISGWVLSMAFYSPEVRGMFRPVEASVHLSSASVQS